MSLNFLTILFRGQRHDPLAADLSAARQRLTTATDDFLETVRATLDRHEGQPPERAPPINVRKTN